MIPENRKISDELLAKYLTGEATDAEQALVQSWVGENEENNKQFYHFKTLWEESRHLANTQAVDIDAAWSRFKERTQQPAAKVIALPRYNWLKVAAVLLLLAGGGWLATVMFYSPENNEVTVKQKVQQPVNVRLPEVNNPQVATAVNNTSELQPEIKTVATTMDTKTLNAGKIAMAKPKTKFMNVAYKSPLDKYNHTHDFVCNATTGALEICIIQSVKCADGDLMSTSTCSVLEPDVSGQLKYKAFDKITRNCKTNVQEIRIRQITTGETVVLNENSKPATALEFFNYISGEKKGDILAGLFTTSCDNQTNDCDLTFNNNYGSLILQ